MTVMIYACTLVKVSSTLVECTSANVTAFLHTLTVVVLCPVKAVAQEKQRNFYVGFSDSDR